MPWYDWVLIVGILYMFIGTDFSLNWLGGLAYGKRLSHHSKSPLKRCFYILWAHYDPNTRIENPDGPKEVLPPWITAISVLNGTIVCALELLLIIGFFMMDAEFVRPCAFAFLLRGVIEFIHGSELMFGPARLKGASLVKYLIIGLIPLVYIPSLVAWRFCGLGMSALGIFIFLLLPLILFLWVAIVYRRKAREMKSESGL